MAIRLLALVFLLPMLSICLAAEDVGYKLLPAKVPDIEKGKASIIQGVVDADGDKFFIEHLDMLQPVSVVLMAGDIRKPLKLNLSKYRYEESDRAGVTGDEGAVAFHFRTQGELKIHVTPQKDPGAAKTPYYLVAWVGDEFEPEMDPPVVVIDKDEGETNWKLIALLLLGVIVFIGAFMFGRRSA